MQVHGAGLAAGDQELPDIVHVLDRLMLGVELLKRDECRCERFRDNPFVVAGDALLRHRSVLPSQRSERSRLPLAGPDGIGEMLTQLQGNQKERRRGSEPPQRNNAPSAQSECGSRASDRISRELPKTNRKRHRMWEATMLSEKFFLVLETLRSHTPPDH